MKNKTRVSIRRQLLYILTLMSILIIICFLVNGSENSEINTATIEFVTPSTTVSSVNMITCTITITTTSVSTTHITETTDTSVQSSTHTEVVTESVTEITDIYIPEEIDDISENEESDMICLGNLKVTGYVATGNPTSSGEMPYVGGIAMNSSFIKEYGLSYGDQIYIEGFGYYTLNDTGCKYGVVDVFCSSIDECYDITSYADVYLERGGD